MYKRYRGQLRDVHLAEHPLQSGDDVIAKSLPSYLIAVHTFFDWSVSLIGSESLSVDVGMFS